MMATWDGGLTGHGVVVTVVDDGMEHDHPDLINNYDALASWDMNGNDADPYPNEADPINSHGTRCCGQIAMALNNNVCGVGVAYRAGIGAVRMLDGDVTDSIEARSLSLQPQHVDIYTNSWGPNDDGRTMVGPGPLAAQALESGATSGRGGLGSIYLFANGNGGQSGDNCNADGYSNSIFTIAIGAIAQDGSTPWYSEPCTATMAVTYSSGGPGLGAIATVDLHHGCTTDHTGTSAASPMAAGIMALVLEANPGLGWRDVQHIIARTAVPLPVNKGPRGTSQPHPLVGFGRLDVAAMVAAARTWKNVGPQVVWRSSVANVARSIPFARLSAGARLATVAVSAGSTPIRHLEHVQVAINLDSTYRGANVIELVSPLGTVSELMSVRRYDDDSGGMQWTFMTVFCWDENPVGTWTLRVRNALASRYTGFWNDWQLILYGTA